MRLCDRLVGTVYRVRGSQPKPSVTLLLRVDVGVLSRCASSILQDRELVLLEYCVPASGGVQPGFSVLCLTASSHCLLLVVLLLEPIVSQGSLDGILRKHWGCECHSLNIGFCTYMCGEGWTKKTNVQSLTTYWSSGV